MAFRGKEMMKKVLKKVGEKNLTPKAKQSLEKCFPKSKVVMNRAKRGLFAGKHIQFGNSVSEDGGNRFVFISLINFYFRNCLLFLIVKLGWKFSCFSS
jgi:hypothetical protein